MRRALMLAAALACAAATATVAAPPAPPPPIADNSFLVEEAYNQEPRVVQHIFGWVRTDPGGASEYSFTQEWPFLSRRHQLSYTVPLAPGEEGGRRATGLGDLGLHYRFQWLGIEDGALAAAPRVTVFLPTGDADRQRGAGAAGFQLNLPVSAALSPRWVAHLNAGATYVGGADGAPARRGLHLAQGLVWHATPRVNPLIEVAWEGSEAARSSSGGAREECFVVSPGLRWAHDRPGGLQIVPGLAFPIGLGASRGENALLLYLSLEHGF